MQTRLHSLSAKGISRLLLGCVLFTGSGCAMFEDDTPKKYTRNSPNSKTIHRAKPSGKPSDPNEFLILDKPKPSDEIDE